MARCPRAGTRRSPAKVGVRDPRAAQGWQGFLGEWRGEERGLGVAWRTQGVWLGWGQGRVQGGGLEV